MGLESSDEDEAAARSPPAGPAEAGPAQPQRTPDSGGRLKRRRDEPAPPANGGLEDADIDAEKPSWAHAVRCSFVYPGSSISARDRKLLVDIQCGGHVGCV